MNTDSTNKWLSLAANVGVLIGLFLVAYEVRQTNAALDRDYDVFWTDVQGRSREGWREFNGRIIESAEVADIWMRGGAGEELSPVESQRFRYLATDILLLYEDMFDQWQILGRDTEWIFIWLDSSIEDRPGLRKELVRIVELNRDAAFARTILESYPELLVED
jgi:hypothetical protein